MVEAHDGALQCKPATLEKLIGTFEVSGIEFIGTPEDGPGIRIRIAHTKPPV